MRPVIQSDHGTAWEGDDRQGMNATSSEAIGWRFRFMSGDLVRFQEAVQGASASSVRKLFRDRSIFVVGDVRNVSDKNRLMPCTSILLTKIPSEKCQNRPQGSFYSFM